MASEGPNEGGPSSLPSVLPKFDAPKSDAAAKLAAATVGLVSKAEFTKRREELEKVELAAEGGESGEKKKKKKKKPTSALSFGDDEEEEEAAAAALPKKPKLGKNPSIDTSFLPDKEREEAEQKRREVLAEAYMKEQDAIKAELVEVHYSFHTLTPQKDGRKGQRHSVNVPKGFTIEQFLNKCREQVREIRACSADQLIYVKEDLILPSNISFYDLIKSKARGKSGPLFHFDVHDDVRIGGAVNDVRIEKDESHPGKVMEKALYNRNKDKFPYSRFEVYDPTKTYESYSTHGHEVHGSGVNTSLV